MWQSKSAKIVIDPSFQAPIYAAVVVIGSQVYEFTGKTGVLKPTDNWGDGMREWVNPHSFRNSKRSQWRTSFLGWLLDTRTSAEIYLDVFAEVVGNGFPLGPTVFPDSFDLPAGYARVMLYTDLPNELRVSGDFPDQEGRMLYVIDLPISGAK